MATLVLYNGDCIQNNKYTVTSETARSATSTDVQSIPVARGSGSTVVNSRLEAKVFSLDGTIKSPAGMDLQTTTKDFDAIFNLGDQRLRFITEYEYIFDGQDTTGWTGSSDASNLSIDSENFNFLAGSLKFDIDVSASGDDFAVLENSSLTQVDISNIENPNIEFTLDLPNVEYISEIELRVGNDSSNYYDAIFSSQIFARSLQNGRNMFSVPLADMTETGTVTDTAIDYVYLKISYTSDQEDMTCHFDGVYVANENRIRNYRVYKTGSTERDDGHFWIDTITYSGLTFLCPDGYGTSTHEVELFDLTAQSSNPNTNTITLDGSTNLSPLYTLIINSQTNLQNVKISNETVGQSLTFSRTWQDGDVFTFGGLALISTVGANVLEFEGQIPDHRPGKNKIDLSFSLSTSQTQGFTSYNANRNQDNASGGVVPKMGLMAQSFVAGETGTISDLKLHIAERTPTSGYDPGPAAVWLRADNGGNPDGSFSKSSYDGLVDVSSGSTFSTVSLTTSGKSFSVTTGTTYWIVVESSYEPDFARATYRTYWSYNTAGGVTGVAKGSDDSASTWSSLSGDQVYEITISPPVSVNYDWKATYFKLYV
jgi:hypothetical protein